MSDNKGVAVAGMDTLSKICNMKQWHLGRIAGNCGLPMHHAGRHLFEEETKPVDGKIISSNSLPTVNDLSLAIVVLNKDIENLVEKFSVKFGVSAEVLVTEDSLKLGKYNILTKIVKINGVITD